MHPVLYESGPVTVTGYGLMLSLSFVAGVVLARARARKVGIEPRRIMDLCRLLMVAAIVGSRLLHVAEHRSHYAADPWRVFRIWEGGLSMYGGVILAIATALLYARVTKESFATLADICAPSIALGEAMTRLGCFLNGCCFGVQCDLPWGVVFPSGSLAARVFPATAIHPTQLYASLYSLLILAVLLLVERRERKPGFIFGLFLMLHGTARFLVEFVRFHASSEIDWAQSAAGISSPQLISLGLFAIGSYFVLAAATPFTGASRRAA